MFSYIAYGLRICSDLPLPELSINQAGPAKDETDVSIHFGEIEAISFAKNGAARHIHATDGKIYLFWQGVGLFLVRDGSEIIIDPAPGVSEDTLRLFVLGTTLAMLLHQRGLVVLHASTVVIAGQAVAFAGEKGTGKSMMAATLQAQGHDLLADDILAIDIRSGCPMAWPGFPHLKLWPDSLVALGYKADTLPRLHPEVEKRGYHLTSGFAQELTPLERIYVLKQGAGLTIEPLCPHQAWLELMPHWYGARFGAKLLQDLGLSSHFLQCAALVNKITICRLERPNCLAALPDVARLVEKHLAFDLASVIA